MAISIKCTCGKNLRVDEKHRGKKVKCPACGSAVLVVESDPETSVKADKPRKAGPPPDAVSAKKPRKPVPVPNEDEDEEDRDEDEERSKKSRKSKKSKAAKSGGAKFVVLAGILALVLCVVPSIGLGIWFFALRGPGGPGGGGGGGGGGAAAVDDLRFIPDGAAGFVSIRIADILANPSLQDQFNKSPKKAEIDKSIAEMETQIGVRPENVERLTMIVRSFDGGPFGSPETVMVVKTGKAVDRQKMLESVTKSKGLKEQKSETDGITVHVLDGGRDAMAIHFVSDNVLVLAEKEKNVRDLIAQAKTAPTSATLTRGKQMASDGKHQLVAAFDVAPKTLDNLPPDFWKQAPNLRDMNGIVAAGNMANEVALECAILFADAGKAGLAKNDAETLKGVANTTIKLMGKAPPTVTKMLDSITIEHRNSEVVVNAKVDVDLQALGPINPFAAFGNNQRIQSINNLKNIALGMHGFHDANKRFPMYAENNKTPKSPGLSWRVAILPFLDEYALYKQIRHDEPYDSPHNKAFWNKMPTAYQLPGKPNDGRTYYQVFRGDETIFPLNRNTKVNLISIPDGSSNTILVVEAAKSVNWMAPDDIPFQGKQTGLQNLLGNHWGDNTFHAAMGDAVVHTFRRTMPEQALRAFITRAGGENVDFSQLVK